MQQFNHSHYAMLIVNNPKAAKEYLKQFQTGEEIKTKSDREKKVKELKEAWIRIFPNYKDETVNKMYNEHIKWEKSLSIN